MKTCMLLAAAFITTTSTVHASCALMLQYDVIEGAMEAAARGEIPWNAAYATAHVVRSTPLDEKEACLMRLPSGEALLRAYERRLYVEAAKQGLLIGGW